MMTSFVDVVLNDEDLELPAELLENVSFVLKNLKRVLFF